jgi:nucleoside-diphosphate-sugar epimerase
MRVFLLGATGALGAHLVPQLIGRDHAVTVATRSPANAKRLTEQGAQAAVVDALDREALIAAVRRAQPEILIDQLTAIPARLDMRHFDRAFEATNRLRTEGTDNALAAARQAGVRRVMAQSFAGWTYARKGGQVKTEEDPFDTDPPTEFRRTLRAIQYLEQAVRGERNMEGIILRYGSFYGPETSLARNGTHVEDIRQRMFPLVGNGQGVWSFIHIADAASATVAAAERGAPGVYNVVDDEPAQVAEWLPVLAAAVGAPPPRHVPAWLARILIGQHAVTLMTLNRGASNEKIKRQFMWERGYHSWRQGFLTGLG